MSLVNGRCAYGAGIEMIGSHSATLQEVDVMSMLSVELSRSALTAQIRCAPA